jgi:predicted Zn-dependent protease
MHYLILIPLFFFIISCNNNETSIEALSVDKINDVLSTSSAAMDFEINAFTLKQDIAFGNEFADELLKNKKEYPILDSLKNKKLYAYLYSIRSSLLNNSALRYKTIFKWKIQIINRNDIINAFCSPGGHIYVYTGLLKYLKSEAELAGVMAHEMAHADRRHSTRQMTKQLGIELISKYLLKNSYGIAELGGALLGLRYSRAYETEADEYSVAYLCNTKYYSAGSAKFFYRMLKKKDSEQIQFMSTHPSHINRIYDIKKTKQDMGCTSLSLFEQEYQNTISKLLK